MLRWIFGLGLVLVIGVTGLFASLAVFSTQAVSMMPTVQPGQRFVVSKLAYGYSTVSLPLVGRQLEPKMLITGAAPERGDVIVFLDTTQSQDLTVLSRVVAVAGDEVVYRDGRLILNGSEVTREALGILDLTMRHGQETVARYRETLPGGRSHEILEAGDNGAFDQTRPFIVPAGHVFVLGDNRDYSRDSRVPGGPGMVPLARILGRVSG